MKDEYEFRGQHVDNKEWVYGDLLQYPCGKKEIACWEKVPFNDNHFSTYEVDPATVGQFTGHIDKNKERLFKLDLVHIDECKDPLLVIQDNFGAWCLSDPNNVLNLDKFYEFKELNFSTIKKIGNIHDNKELIK